MSESGNVARTEGKKAEIDLEALSKYAAVLGIVAYAVGTLTINIYLHWLGITDFSLAKPKLALTGVVVLVSFLLLALLPFFVGRGKIGWPSTKTLATLATARSPLLLLLPLLLLILVASHLSKPYPPGLGEELVWKMRVEYGKAEDTTAAVICAFVYIPIWLTVWFGRKASRALRQAKLASNGADAVTEAIYFCVTLALAVVSFFGYIYVFSITFYPALPTAFGGGKPYYEQFVVEDPTDKAQWGNLGVPFPYANSYITAPLAVLHESDTMVAVWVEKDKGQRPAVAQLLKTEITAALIVNATEGKDLNGP